mmetsp:Transcript_27349/g.68228  ORF Transcript_27349/g.68228 Transcript_27349/m.68228 type:complete len:416 (-) Transcript_27349:282-1529(-)
MDVVGHEVERVEHIAQLSVDLGQRVVGICGAHLQRDADRYRQLFVIIWELHVECLAELFEVEYVVFPVIFPAGGLASGLDGLSAVGSVVCLSATRIQTRGVAENPVTTAGGILPIDVKTVNDRMIFHPFDVIGDHFLAKSLVGRALGELGGEGPAADGVDELEVRLLLLEDLKGFQVAHAGFLPRGHARELPLVGGLDVSIRIGVAQFAVFVKVGECVKHVCDAVEDGLHVERLEIPRIRHRVIDGPIAEVSHHPLDRRLGTTRRLFAFERRLRCRGRPACGGHGRPRSCSWLLGRGYWGSRRNSRLTCGLFCRCRLSRRRFLRRGCWLLGGRLCRLPCWHDSCLGPLSTPVVRRPQHVTVPLAPAVVAGPPLSVRPIGVVAVVAPLVGACPFGAVAGVFQLLVLVVLVLLARAP